MNRTQPKKFLVPFLFSLTVSLAADWLAGAPQTVEKPMSAGQWAALLVQFSLWMSGVLAWGSLIQSLVKPKSEYKSAGISLALGSVAYSLFAMALATIGFLRPELRYLLWILQSVGIGLAGIPDLTNLRTAIRVNKRLLLALLPLSLFFLLNFGDAFLISPYWDALHHHLTGVRLFWENGQMYFPSTAIASYQEGGFEMLFLWPHFFLAKAGGLGLIPVQVFSQLMHLLLGFGGSLLMAYAFATRWLPSPAWRAFALTLFAAPLSLHFAIPTAKNEWGIILWVLAGFYLLALPEKEETKKVTNIRLFLAGLLWGFAWLAKLSSGFALMSFLAIFYFQSFPKRNNALVWIAGLIVGAIPLAFRNYLATNDPFFPLFPNFFHVPPETIGPTWLEAMSKYGANPSGLARLKEWTQEFPLAGVSLAIPLLAFVRKEEPALRSAALAPVIGLILFAFTAGAATELRLLGALIPLSALVLAVLIQRVSTRLPFSPAPLPWILLVLLAILLPYRWEAARRIHALPKNHLLVRSYVSGEAQSWFREHYRPGMKAALLNESRFYHSIPYPVIRIWDAPLLDAKLRATKSALEFLNVLKQEGFSHLILSNEKLDVFYPKDQVAAVEAFALQHPDAFAFQSPHSIVVDMEKLTGKAH